MCSAALVRCDSEDNVITGQPPRWRDFLLRCALLDSPTAVPHIRLFCCFRFKRYLGFLCYSKLEKIGIERTLLYLLSRLTTFYYLGPSSFNKSFSHHPFSHFGNCQGRSKQETQARLPTPHYPQL